MDENWEGVLLLGPPYANSGQLEQRKCRGIVDIVENLNRSE